jgi:hypothetical protein
VFLARARKTGRHPTRRRHQTGIHRLLEDARLVTRFRLIGFRIWISSSDFGYKCTSLESGTKVLVLRYYRAFVLVRIPPLQWITGSRDRRNSGIEQQQ